MDYLAKINTELDEIFISVEKPTRYIGGEVNSIIKDKNKVDIHFGFCFPDLYEVGMSHLGSHILYGVLNNIDFVYCERIYFPWVDMIEEIEKRDMKMFTIETKTYLDELDIINFTLQYELCYTNILKILELSKIEFLSKDRKETDPIIMAGGSCAYNPEPLADIIDLFCLGEGEEVLVELMELLRKKKKENLSKEEFLFLASNIEGIYVPSFYDVIYNEDFTIKSVEPNRKDIKKTIKKRIIKDLDKSYYPEKFIIPYMDIVHDRAVIEIFRGCTRGCRFCQAGMIYRPIREKSKDTIIKQSKEIIKNTGFEEIALSSLSTLDYNGIEDLIFRMNEDFYEDNTSLSLPSLRTDDLNVNIIKEIQKTKKTGLTFAPEAGSQRLRDVINKNVTRDDLVQTLTKIYKIGYHRVKLYFMIGLPTENYDDIDEINELGNLATYLFKNIKDKPSTKNVSVTLSVSAFVPKPFTPFQWIKQNTIEEFDEKQRYLRKIITNKKIRYTYHDAKTATLEDVFARGDRRLSKVLINAVKKGQILDGWMEFFDYDRWMEAFKEENIDPKFYNRERSLDEILPWDHIDVGVDKEFLKREWEKAEDGKTSRDCRSGCLGCNINTNILKEDCFYGFKNKI